MALTLQFIVLLKVIIIFNILKLFSQDPIFST